MRRTYLLNILLVLINLYIIVLLFPTIKNLTLTIFHVISPFLIGFTIAYLLSPLINLLSKKINRKFIIFLTIILFAIIIFTFILIVVPKLIVEIEELIDSLPLLIEKIEIFAKQKLQNIGIEITNENQIIDRIKEYLYDHFIDLLDNIVVITQKTFSILISSILSIITSIYFLLDFDHIKEFLKQKLSKTVFLLSYLKELNIVMRGYLRGVFLVSFILTCISSVFLSIIDIPFSLLLGIIIGITNIIPYIGPYIGGGIAVVIALTISFKKAIIVLIGVIIIQLIESTLITPNVQSKSVNIHPILVIFSIILLGEFFNIFGMIIAIPIIACIQTYIKCLNLKGKKC